MVDPKRQTAGAERKRRRARRPDDKQARRQAIVDAALALFESRRFSEVKISDIAARAGLAKGTVFLYFTTKEELFLELLSQLLDDWLAELDGLLGRGRGPWSSARVARTICDTLIPREPLTRLFTMISSVLEQNVPVESVAAFKRRLLARLSITGALLERRLRHLAPGDGGRLLLYVYALVVGARQLSEPGDAGREALADPALAPLIVEFEPTLHDLLAAVLRGLEAGAPERRDARARG